MTNPTKRGFQNLVTLVGTVALMLILAACGTAVLNESDAVSNDTGSEQFDFNSIDYSAGLTVNYATGLTNGLTTQATQLLANSSFDTNTDWFNCAAAANSNISAGTLTLSGDSACVYQTLAATAGETYTLVCDGNSSAAYTSVTLSTLDVAWNAVGTSTVLLGDASTTNTSLIAAPDATYVAVTLYSNGPATFAACSLTTDVDPVVPVDPVDPVDPSDELLANPGFNTNTDWFNCSNAANSNISNGKLTLSGDSACVFQTVPVTANTEYTLVCDSTSSAIWSNVSLYMLDENFSIITGNTVQVDDKTAQPSVVTSLVSPQNTTYATVTIYSEGPAVHESCSLSTSGTTTPTGPDPVTPIAPTNPVDNEAELALSNLLIDPSFDEGNAAWVNCAPANAKVAGGSLYIEPNSCFYQDVAINAAALAGGEINLTCKGSTSFPNSATTVSGISEVAYSGFILSTLDDKNFYLPVEEGQYIGTSARQWRISWDGSKLEPTTETLRVQFNGVSPSVYEYCYLSTTAVPALISEPISPPSKPLGVIATLYTDPASDPVSWQKLVDAAKTSSDVELMVVINPSNNDPFLAPDNPTVSIPLCDYGAYGPVMEDLQAAGVDAIGYVPVGFIADRYSVADVKANIDRYASCAHLDGIFFDEVQILEESDAAYYKEICDYAVSKYPNGEFILNVGAHPDYVVHKNSCNITLVYENNVNKWDDFFMYDYGSNPNHPYSFVEMYGVDTVATLQAGVDSAMSRGADYIYMTHRSSQYQLWGEIFDKWAELIDYVGQQNRTLY